MVLLHEVLPDAERLEALAPVGLLEEPALVAVHAGHDQQGVGQCGLARLHGGRTIALERPRQSRRPRSGGAAPPAGCSVTPASSRRSTARVAAWVLSIAPRVAAFRSNLR